MEPTERCQGRIVVGRYRLLERLGEGSTGTVFRATQFGLDREVAVKVLAESLTGQPESRARFLREARVAARLRHPNAVEVIDFGEDGGCVFVVMELLRGGSLRAHLSRLQCLPVERVTAIGRTVADLLVAAHAIELVHRDLKPENIFLERFADGQERLVVVDFGLAFIANGDDSIGRLTRDGVLGGSPHYMAPEQALGVAVGPAADVYSLGCVLYELATGRVPFDAHKLAVLLSRQVYAAPTPMGKRAPDANIPTKLDELILAMLAKAPGDRPGALEVRRRLEELSSVAADDRERERGRDVSYLGERAERMVPAASVVVAPDAVRELGVVQLLAPLADDLMVGLRSAGLEVRLVEAPAEVEAGMVVFAPDASETSVASMVAAGARVVAAAELADLDRVTALVRAGVSDVVTRPLSADSLCRKLRRAARRRGQLS